jgi:hypothetical protein
MNFKLLFLPLLILLTSCSKDPYKCDCSNIAFQDFRQPGQGSKPYTHKAITGEKKATLGISHLDVNISGKSKDIATEQERWEKKQNKPEKIDVVCPKTNSQKSAC